MDTEYYTMRDLTDLLKVHRNTIWTWIREKDFPKGMALGGAGRRWTTSEVSAWLNKQREDTV